MKVLTPSLPREEEGEVASPVLYRPLYMFPDLLVGFRPPWSTLSLFVRGDVTTFSGSLEMSDPEVDFPCRREEEGREVPSLD